MLLDWPAKGPLPEWNRDLTDGATGTFMQLCGGRIIQAEGSLLQNPEAGASLVHLRNGKETSVEGEE